MTGCPRCGAQIPAGNDFCDDCGTRLEAGIPAIDRYALEGVLGRGASSVVYRASDRRTGKAVAVTALNPELLAKPGLRRRLRDEARSLQQLSQENIVRVVDYVETDSAVWLVTDAVSGASLRSVLIQAHQLHPEQALAIFEGVLAGLEHAHQHGIVHGDLKPENILVEATGTAKLVDFGQAVRAGEETTGGTAAYMAPEAVRGEAIGTEADIYSLGAILFEALSGRPPFIAATETDLMRMQLEEPSPPVVGLPAALGELVAAMLEKDAPRRPTATAARAKFEEAVRAAYGTEWRQRASVADLVRSTATRFPTITTDPAAGQSPATAAGIADPYTELSPGPQAQLALDGGIRRLRYVLALELLWMLTFAGGGGLLIYRLYERGTAQQSCLLAPGFTGLNASTSCPTHVSLVLPIVFIVVGFVAFWATGVIASTWAMRRYGVSLASYVRRGRRPRPSMAATGLGGAQGGAFPGTPGQPGGPGWPGTPENFGS